MIDTGRNEIHRKRERERKNYIYRRIEKEGEREKMDQFI
jgi:hypothetical protein